MVVVGGDLPRRGLQVTVVMGMGGPGHRVRQEGRPGGTYFMPLRSTWLAAMSMTLMMKAMAKAQIRLLRTHV